MHGGAWQGWWGSKTGLCSQPGPCSSSQPFSGEEKNKNKPAVIKQLSGNQIILRTEKPINKGAVKTNITTGAAGKCKANRGQQAGVGWEVHCGLGCSGCVPRRKEDTAPPHHIPAGLSRASVLEPRGGVQACQDLCCPSGLALGSFTHEFLKG